MKVLDPFAGYRLASGHPIFHVSLFIGSYTATTLVHRSVNDTIESSFWVLRWSHCLLFILALVSFICDKDSDIPESQESENLDESLTEAEKKELV